MVDTVILPLLNCDAIALSYSLVTNVSPNFRGGQELVKAVSTSEFVQFVAKNSGSDWQNRLTGKVFGSKALC